MTRIRITSVCLALACATFFAGCGWNDPDVLFERGIRAYEAGRYKSASRFLQRSVKLEPGHAAAQLWCGAVLWKMGDYEEALPYFMAASQLDAANPLPLEYAALIHVERGEWLEVGKRLNEAFRRNSDSPRILNAMGVATAMRGNATASRIQLQQALRLSPEYAPAIYNAAILYRDALNQTEEARRLFTRYLELAPDGDKANAARTALESMGLPASSALRGRAPRAENRVDILMRQAGAAMKRQDFDEAAVRLREAVEEDETSAEALWRLASLYDAQGSPEQALNSFRMFIHLFPEDTRAGKARQKVNDLTGKRVAKISPPVPPPEMLEDGDISFKKPEVRNPREAWVFIRRGTKYYAARDWDRALFDFRAAIELDDSLPEPYYNLGLVYWCKGDLERARQLFQNALSRKQDWADARCMLARVYFKQRLGIKAVEHLNEILKTSPLYADAYYELGSFYREAPGRRQQARGCYDKYLQLAPAGAYASDARAWLAANP